jgi:hypothetical protein
MPAGGLRVRGLLHIESIGKISGMAIDAMAISM